MVRVFRPMLSQDDHASQNQLAFMKDAKRFSKERSFSKTAHDCFETLYAIAI